MNEIEMRLADDSWDLDIAKKVRVTRAHRRNKNIAVGTTLFTCAAAVTTALTITMSSGVSDPGFINYQIYGTVEGVYSDYELSEDTIDGFILTQLAER